MNEKISLVNENRDSDNYDGFLDSIKDNFNSIVSSGIPLFTTNSEGLYDLFLDNLPHEARQTYTCMACNRFVDKYGGLVAISEDGNTKSVLWEGNVPNFFKASVEAMKNTVLKSRVNGIFITDNKVLGQPVTKEWYHISVTLPDSIVYKATLNTASQMMAEKLEDFRILMSGLLEYPVEAVGQAVTILKTESLYRSEKCLGVAEWLKDLHNKRDNKKNSRISENFVWLAVATAPVGYCHIKSSMIGTLLDDIVSGLSFESVSRRFSEKMNPLQYQRPQAAPTIGNIQQAEKIVEKLGIQKSLIRRFARLEEIQKIWTPKDKKEETKKSGVFSHLKTKGKQAVSSMNLPTITMTWRKFFETTLPLVDRIEYFVQSGKQNYSAILTAFHEDAPPILQWDNAEKRNPFSHYVYSGGSHCSNWGLSTGFCNVTGVCYQPSMWNGDFPHQGKAVIFILEGAKDKKYKNAGNALFPETLKSELREIRSVIEAYSKDSTIEDCANASACGIRLQYGSEWNITIRVTTNGQITTYILDRWD